MNTVAAAIILTSSFTAAFLIIRSENIHYRNLLVASDFINRVKDTAAFYNNSFGSIINFLNETGEFKNADYIASFVLHINSGISPPEAWRKAIEGSNLNFTKRETETLIKFGCDMCSCSREKIEECGKTALALFDEFKSHSCEKRKNKTKTTAVVAIAAGLVTVLMFI